MLPLHVEYLQELYLEDYFLTLSLCYPEEIFRTKELKEDKDLAGTILYTGAEALRISAVLLSSIMPARTKKLFQILNTDSRDRKWGGLKSGIKLGALSALFPRIDSQHK